jgi:hypothetical protein
METEIHKQRKNKNYAILGALIAFIAIVFAVTILRMM